MSDYFLSILIAFIGLVLHWYKKWIRKEIASDFQTYLLVDYKRHTLTSIVGLIVAVGTLVSTVTVDFEEASFVANLVLTGYAVDSAVNKGRKKWP